MLAMRVVIIFNEKHLKEGKNNLNKVCKSISYKKIDIIRDTKREEKFSRSHNNHSMIKTIQFPYI
jgi:hypothetical protein